MGHIAFDTDTKTDEYLFKKLTELVSKGVLKMKDGRLGVVLHMIKKYIKEEV